MIVFNKGWGALTSGRRSRRRIVRVMVEEEGKPRTRYKVGETDGLPDDGWLAARGVNPSSVIDRKIRVLRGEKFWLVTVA